MFKKLIYYFKRFSKDQGSLLLRKVAKGNELAFRELVYQHYDQLFNYTFHFVKSYKVGEAMVEETFAKVWRYRHTIDHSYSSAPDCLYKITAGLIFDYLYQVANEQELRKELWRHLQMAVDESEDLIIQAESSEVTDYAITYFALRRQLVHKLSIP